MKFLILTCSTGGGHHAAAAAISDYLTARGQTCVIMDCLDFLPALKAKLISEGHVFLYRRAPKLFGLGYHFEETHMPSLIVSQCSACADEFCEAVNACGCDAVINVHVFSALIMTAARTQYGLALPGYFVATDFTCSPGVGLASQDAYFIPHKDLTEEFVRCGIPAERIVPTGIPVHANFGTRVPKQEARQQLSLPEAGALVLLSCGSMGAGPMEELAHRLDRQLPPQDQLMVICGTNDSLRQKLAAQPFSSRVMVEGFVTDMSLRMDAADLLLSKAGGLATSEAMEKRLPLVCIDAVPGCETRNLAFLVEHGCARTAGSAEELTDLVCSLLQTPTQLDNMRTNAANEFPEPAVEQIYRHLAAVHTL